MKVSKRSVPNEFVYFIAAPAVGLIKIGYSAESPDGRLAAIRTASPVSLERLAVIRGSYYFEQLLHWRFSPDLSHLEWFRASDRLNGFISAHASPWTAPVIHPASVAANEPEVMRADPWFRSTARKLARAVELGRGESVWADPKTGLRLFQVMPYTAPIVERAKLRARRDVAAEADLVIVSFKGGPSDGTVQPFSRKHLGLILREGITLTGKRDHIYTIGRPALDEDMQADRVEVVHQGFRR